MSLSINLFGNFRDILNKMTITLPVCQWKGMIWRCAIVCMTHHISTNVRCHLEYQGVFTEFFYFAATIISVMNVNKIVLTFYRPSIAARIICYKHWSSTKGPLFYTTSVHQNILQATSLRHIFWLQSLRLGLEVYPRDFIKFCKMVDHLS